MAGLANETLLRTALKLLGLVVGTPCILTLFYVAKVFIGAQSSPLMSLQCPPGGRFLSGHMLMLTRGHSYENLSKWREQYGSLFAIKAVLGQRRSVTTDTKAIAHILANSQKYCKPEAARWHLSYLLGNGMVTAEGHEHRHQRRAINPAFSLTNLKNIFPTFMSKAEQLCDMIRHEVADAKTARVDVLQWSSRAALDIIALSGFNYDLDTLHKGMDGSELATALHRLSSPKTFPIIIFFKIFIPPLRMIQFDHQSRETQHTRGILRNIGVNIIKEKQRQLSLEKTDKEATIEPEYGKGDQDLLSSIVRLNTEAEGENLSMEQMLQQIPTFLVAGHETTANTLAWALFSLSHNQVVQDRLRNEIMASALRESAAISLEDLNALPYLEAVIRETLRFHATVEVITRVATQEDVIPLEKSYVAQDGKLHDQFIVKKGDHIMIPILVINRLKEFWGEDADEFSPDRWLKGAPDTSNAIPGLWSNIMTFSTGNRSCIGYKFAIFELKALLFQLIKNFRFDPAVPYGDVIRNELIVTRPQVKSERDKGAQLPLVITPVAHE
ncbi:hypothetical protein M408DRAFT_332466 [Serendipita vermifera MAFF 305830]|uniref:Cytochrome P450 n=1 Tax=Serendipita vermifera MAFF 305830 TaxID=933852 RepID=A0A0C2X101_SERVB|nr:hypothetical protein M408DRAFT_332466 [Serendipita vermifera MAFF 305830]